MSHKGAKGRARRRVRSTGTKVSARADSSPESYADLEQQLQACKRELAHAREHLARALERQTATSEVLHVISSSAGELAPVFQAVLENAVRLCDAKFGTLNLYEGKAFRNVALHNAPAEYTKMRRGVVIHPDPRTSLGRIVSTRELVHVEDLRSTQPYLEGNPDVHALSDLAGARSLVTVPMLKDNELMGVIGIYRQEVRPFNDKQIELVKNFAAQAAIAIENTRLLNELRESLQQQTATADVLKVISSSPNELEPVFRTILENAIRVCDAKFGTLFRYDAEALHLAAGIGTPPALAEFQRGRGAFRPEVGTLHHRVLQTRQLAHSADYAAEPNPGNAATLGGARSTVVVPMLKDDELIGTIVIYRQEVRPFTDKQVQLVQNFAHQAVIAIENVRLLTELRESLQQQTATADVLKVISRSTCTPCSIHLCSPLRCCARRTTRPFGVRMATGSSSSPITVRSLSSLSRWFVGQSRAGRFSIGELSILLTCRPRRTNFPRPAKTHDVGASARYFASP